MITSNFCTQDVFSEGQLLPFGHAGNARRTGQTSVLLVSLKARSPSDANMSQYRIRLALPDIFWLVAQGAQRFREEVGMNVIVDEWAILERYRVKGSVVW